MSAPTRNPAAARTFENVLEMTMFGNSARRPTSEVPAKSEYASSTSTSVSGYCSATERITSSAIVLPVGLFGVVKTTISGRTLAIAASARSLVTS